VVKLYDIRHSIIGTEELEPVIFDRTLQRKATIFFFFFFSKLPTLLFTKQQKMEIVIPIAIFCVFFCVKFQTVFINFSKFWIMYIHCSQLKSLNHPKDNVINHTCATKYFFNILLHK